MYKRDDAVSPVIGVILMVAITVILAAVIAAFVFGMAGNVQKTKNVAFTVERSSQAQDHVIVTSQGGKDSPDLSSVYVKIDTHPTVAGPTTIGTFKDITGASTTGKSKVVVTAKFKDGSQQVVVDTQV